MPARPVDIAVDAHAALGEGPCWDPGRRRLYWVNVRACEVHEFDPDTKRDRTMLVPRHVGCVVLRQGGGALAALQDGLVELDLDTGRTVPIANPEGGREDILFNDGKCDPAGRFWVGTKAYADTTGAGALYCMETDRTVHLKLPGVTISNGLAWSLDARRMYYIDTPAMEVSVFDYDVRSGSIKNRRTPGRGSVPGTARRAGTAAVLFWRLRTGASRGLAPEPGKNDGR